MGLRRGSRRAFACLQGQRDELAELCELDQHLGFLLFKGIELPVGIAFQQLVHAIDQC